MDDILGGGAPRIDPQDDSIAAWLGLGLPYSLPLPDRSDAHLRSKYRAVPAALRALDDMAGATSEDELAAVRGRDFAFFDPQTQADLYKASDARWWDLMTAGSDLGDERYSPYLPGWHAFVVGPTRIGGGFVPVDGQIDLDPALDAIRLGTVPGLPDNVPVVDHGRYTIYDPYFGEEVGPVETTISPDGMTTANTTGREHWFYDGKVVNRLRIDDEGNAWVTTYGFGNNQKPLMDEANQFFGPRAFENEHANMTEYLRERRLGER